MVYLNDRKKLFRWRNFDYKSASCIATVFDSIRISYQIHRLYFSLNNIISYIVEFHISSVCLFSHFSSISTAPNEKRINVQKKTK